MNGLGSSDSSIPIRPSSADGPMFLSMLESLEEDACTEESGLVFEKKRRLNSDQVKVLEKNFEVDNRMEPERKVKLALELGLQPRQVAVWFQNRRARWKTKQLERDYGVLKANYDALKQSFEKLQHDNEAFLKEIQDLKSQMDDGGESERNVRLKKETEAFDTKEKKMNSFQAPPVNSGSRSEEKVANNVEFMGGSSDSASSAVFNEDNSSPMAAISSSGELLRHSPHRFPNFRISEVERVSGLKAFQPHFVKIEEHDFFGEDNSCSTFFSDDQAPTLHWYSADDWN